MQIFTIATKVEETIGHGSYGESYQICRMGSYRTGNYPPAFRTEEKAEEYLGTLSRKSNIELLKIVSLEVKE